jgi:hypothetical protein
MYTDMKKPAGDGNPAAGHTDGAIVLDTSSAVAKELGLFLALFRRASRTAATLTQAEGVVVSSGGAA